LKKGDEGGFLKSPLTPLYKRGELTPLTITSPLGGEDEGEGENTPSAWRRHPSVRREGLVFYICTLYNVICR